MPDSLTLLNTSSKLTTISSWVFANTYRPSAMDVNLPDWTMSPNTRWILSYACSLLFFKPCGSTT